MATVSTALVPFSKGTNDEMVDVMESETRSSSLSSIPSKNNEEEAEKLSKPDDADENHHVKTTTGIDEACLLVKAILDQVTLNDSPPVNDEIPHPPPSPAVTPRRRLVPSPRLSSPRMSPRTTTSKSSVSTKTTTSSPTCANGRLSRQRHIWQQLDDVVSSPTNSSKSSEQPTAASSPTDGPLEHVSPVQLRIEGHSVEATSVLSLPIQPTDAPNKDPGALWMAHYRKSQTRSEMKMGNVALATLCSRTLDSMADVAEGDHTKDYSKEQQASNKEFLLGEDNEHKDTAEAEPKEKDKVVAFSEKPDHGDTSNERQEAGVVKETTVAEEVSTINSPSKYKRIHGIKKGWFAKRLKGKKKQQKQSETPNQTECHIIQDISTKELQADLNKMALSSNANGDESPLRELDNLPPTPIRTNARRLSGKFDQGADENASITKYQDDDNISLDAIEKMRSEDDEEEEGDVMEDHPNEEDDEDDVMKDHPNEEEDLHESEEQVEHDLHENEDLVLLARSEDELFPNSPTADMEHILEETADEVAAEENEKHEDEPESNDQPSPLKVNTRPPLGRPISSPRARMQMYGSEYARFLSSTPFSPEISTVRSGLGRSSLRRSGRSGKANSFNAVARMVNIEEANSAVLTGAITDLIVTYGSDMPPKGYYRISQTGSGEDFTSLRASGVSKGRKSAPVYLNVKKEPSWDKAAQRPCVTALALIFPDRKEFVPPGFCVVRRYKGTLSSENLTSSSKEGSHPANLNHGSSGERVYLCYRRSREGNPITGIIPLQPSNGEAIPEGYTVLERTPRNFVADINCKNGVPVFLAFRQRLASLETLRPLPLVLSIHYSNIVGANDSDPVRLNSGKKRLSAYYCTGGTVVPSDVGRFHIMDRTTHSLLSPSSVSNRISLIEASRKQHSSVDCADIPKSTASSTYASSDDVDSRHGKSNRALYFSTPSGSVADVGLAGDGSVVSNESSSLHGSISSAGGMTPIKFQKRHSRDRSLSSLSDVTLVDANDELNTSSQTAVETETMGETAHRSIFSYEDIALQSCFEAMNFIPVIEDAGVPADASDFASQVDMLESRVAVLTPILTACYTHHGGSALVAVEGLQKLLTKTDFFKPDVADTEYGASSRLTLLDVAVQSVCDVATSSSRETNFSPCVEFVESAIRYSRGQLNTRTIGYAIRFYLFVFYFGASVPTASSSWPMALKVNPETGDDKYVMNDLPLLQEEGDELDVGAPRPVYPGGAPQAAGLALKELVSLTLVRLRDASSGEREMLATIGQEIVAYVGEQSKAATNPLSGFVDSILSSLVDGAVKCVDLANYTQLAIHQMHRSGGSELFWHDMLNSCGGGLFGQESSGLGEESQRVYIMSFAILANLVKISSVKLRHLSRTREFVPRDLASKLLGMELLLHFLEVWGQEQSVICEDESSTKALKSVNTIAYSIRRLVVPCLLWNTEAGLENNRVFRRIIKLVSELWCTSCYRRKMKMELGVLIEHFVMRLLRLGPQLLPVDDSVEKDIFRGSITTTSSQQKDISKSYLQHQADILLELKRWFDSGSNGVVELFLNYDQDYSPRGDGPTTRLMPGPQWKICQELCAAICIIAEESGETIAKQIKISQNTGMGPPSPRGVSPEKGIEKASVREGGRLLQRNSFDAITEIVKSLAESAATASGPRYKRLLRSWTASSEEDLESIISEDDESLASADEILLTSPRNRVLGIRKRESFTPLPGDAVSPRSRSLSPKRGNEMVDYWKNSIAYERKKGILSSPRGRSVSPMRVRQTPTANHTVRVPSTCPDPKVEPLLAIEAEKSNTNPTESGKDAINPKPKNTEDTLNEAFKIVREKDLKSALEFLVECNFLTPSARDIASFLRIHNTRIDAVVLGKYLGEGGIDGADIEYRNLVRFNYVRAISFVGMNVEEGLRYFLTHCGFRLPGEAQMIDRILTTFSQCFWEDNAGDVQRCPFKDQDTVFLISFAIIMLNTDLHKVQPSTASIRSQRKKMTKPEFLANLRGVDNSEELSRDYLSNIYDSIEANPISIIDEFHLAGLSKKPVGFGSGSNANSATFDSAELLKTMLESVRPSEELLRGLSVHDNPFYSVEDFCDNNGDSEQNALRNLVRKAFSTTWYLFHNVINSMLENAHLDTEGLEYCLDVLKYAICATICLDMTMERSAFVTQLARFKIFAERRDEWFATRAHSSYKLEDWYIDLEMDCADPLDEKAKLSALAQVHAIFEELHSTLQIDSSVKRDMHRAVRQIRNGGYLLNDPARSILREGDLMKRSKRSGRNVTYRFFLFSDVMIYAKATHENDFKVHEELPLFLMKVVDFFPPSAKKYLKRSFEIHHPRKSFLVIAESPEEKKEWVSTIRVAIAKDIDRKARLEKARLTSSMHQWDGAHLCFDG